MADDPVPFKVNDVDTPCLLVDLDKVERNTKNMTDKMERLGLKLRPHMKTAKCLEAGSLMTNGRKRRIVVSTLAEAEFFADGGFDDIILARLFTEDKLSRFQALCQRMSQFHVAVDHDDDVTSLEKHPPGGDGKTWSAFLMVDVGGNREGSMWDDDDTVAVAKRLGKSSKVIFQGLYTHETHVYNARGRHQVEGFADTTTDRLLHLAERLKEEGIECKDVSLGATPTGSHPGEKVRKLTEFHPGNYVFYDIQQEQIGSCSQGDIAVQVAARVIARYPGRRQILIDAGWTALSQQGPTESGTYADFQGYPGLKLVGLTQEIGKIDVDTSLHSIEEDFPVGKLLLLYPYHSCATAAMHRHYHVHRGDDVIGVWRPCYGW